MSKTKKEKRQAYFPFFISHEKQINEESETEEAYRQINEEEIVSAAIESVPRDKPAQCCLCPASSSPVCVCGLMLMFQD